MTSSEFNSYYTFPDYYNMVQELYAKGEVTGNYQNEAMLAYTKLSLARTKRNLKQAVPNEELLAAAKDSKAVNWVVISEGWCGDAGNIVPLFHNMVKECEDLSLKVALRDENPELMNQHLTNGGKSIPILVLYDEQFNELAVWGPRPKPAQDMVIANKTNTSISQEEKAVNLQKWYNSDKSATLQKELLEILNAIN